MPVVEADETLDPVIDAMGEFVRDKGLTLVAAVARIEPDGSVIVRCKGVAPGTGQPHARAMMECLGGLTELRAHLEAPDEDEGAMH